MSEQKEKPKRMSDEKFNRLGSDPFNDFQQDFAAAWHEAERARASEKRLADLVRATAVKTIGPDAPCWCPTVPGKWLGHLERCHSLRIALSELEGA